MKPRSGVTRAWIVPWIAVLAGLGAAPAPAQGPIAVEVAVAGGPRIAVPDRGPERLLVPIDTRVRVAHDAWFEEIGLFVEGFEVRKIPRQRGDAGFLYPRVENSPFRVENLSPVRFSLKRGREETARLQLSIPRAVAPGTYNFRVRASTEDEGHSNYFAIEIVRGTADVDLAPVAIDAIEELGTPESPHPLRFVLKVANDGHHAWASPARARVVVLGEGDERVEVEVPIGIVPGRTRIGVPVEVEVLLPRRIEVQVDPADLLPESDETDNALVADVPGQ